MLCALPTWLHQSPTNALVVGGKPCCAAVLLHYGKVTPQGHLNLRPHL
jgi:hypothetical protein